MGIGGLDDQFTVMFRRAFASRVMPIEIVEKLGIQHVKGKQALRRRDLNLGGRSVSATPIVS